MAGEARQTQPVSGINKAWIVYAAVAGATLIYILLVIAGIIHADNRLNQTELLLFVAVIIFNPAIIGRIASLDISSAGISLRLNAIAHEQRRLDAELEQLKFLITHYLPKYETNHLTKLASGSAFAYRIQGHFYDELWHLRSLGLIQDQAHKSLKNLPQQGNLHEYVAITPAGRQYLDLQQSTGAADSPDPPQAPSSQ